MAGKRRTSAPVRIWDSFREWTSIRYNRKPRAMTLNVIFLVNVALVLLSAWVISRFALPGTGRIGFFAAVYNTLTMMMDAGCIEAIIEDPAGTNLFLIVFCLVVILCSMVTFTGALIGYVTNVISGLIENANANSQPLRISVSARTTPTCS